MAVETTVTMTNQMKTYLDSVFLERNKENMIFKEGGQSRTHTKQDGKLVKFNRLTPLGKATTPLTEGASGSEVSLTSTTVTASLSEYGRYIKVSKFLSLTSIDKDDEEKIEVVGQNMGETLDTIVRDAIYSGATAQLGNGKTVLSNIAATDTFDSVEVRKAVRTLKTNKAMKYSDGTYLGKVNESTSYDLTGDSVWVNAHTYKDGKNLYMGEIGKLYGVRFVESNNGKTESSTVTVHSNFIHGDNAFGYYDLQGDQAKLIIHPPGSAGAADALNRYGTIGWAGAFAAKVLIGTWIINVKTGVTA